MPAEPASKKRPPIDWEAIEREFRNGQLSVSEIARQNGVTHTAINKKAKQNGWKRDLSEKVRAAVAEKLVSAEFQKLTQSETIEAAAERGLRLVREHQRFIGMNFTAVVELLEELRETNAHRQEIEDDILAETADDESGRRRARMLAAVALPSRAQIAGTLASALKTLIPLERQAFNLDAAGNPPDGSESAPVSVSLTDASAEKLARLLE